MATLSPAGRIDGTIVDAEIARLERLWPDHGASGADDGLEDIIGADRLGQIDPTGLLLRANRRAIARALPHPRIKKGRPAVRTAPLFRSWRPE